MDADRPDVEAKILRRNRAALSVLGVLLLISGLSSIAIGRLNYPNWRGAGLVFAPIVVLGGLFLLALAVFKPHAFDNLGSKGSRKKR
jgi:hypothetical protein